MKKVTITANPTTGNVFTQMLNADKTPKTDKNGKEYGYIRVESEEISLGFAYNNGASKKRSTLISMTKDAFVKSAHLLVDGAQANGQIVRKDRLEPWFDGQKPLQAPKRDAAGKVIEGEFHTITSNGAPVFRNEYFTENQNDVDVKLASYDKIVEEVEEEETVLEKK